MIAEPEPSAGLEDADMPANAARGSPGPVEPVEEPSGVAANPFNRKGKKAGRRSSGALGDCRLGFEHRSIFEETCKHTWMGL